MQRLIVASRHLDSHSKANCLKKRFNANILPSHIHRWQHQSKSTWVLVLLITAISACVRHVNYTTYEL